MINAQVVSISTGEDLIRLEWVSDKGFGQYDLVFKNDKEAENVAIEGYSECMDNETSKEFLKALFTDIINKVEIKE